MRDNVLQNFERMLVLNIMLSRVTITNLKIQHINSDVMMFHSEDPVLRFSDVILEAQNVTIQAKHFLIATKPITVASMTLNDETKNSPGIMVRCPENYNTDAQIMKNLLLFQMSCTPCHRGLYGNGVEKEGFLAKKSQKRLNSKGQVRHYVVHVLQVLYAMGRFLVVGISTGSRNDRLVRLNFCDVQIDIVVRPIRIPATQLPRVIKTERAVCAVVVRLTRM